MIIDDFSNELCNLGQLMRSFVSFIQSNQSVNIGYSRATNCYTDAMIVSIQILVIVEITNFQERHVHQSKQRYFSC